MGTTRYVLGTGLSHDASVCLLGDGRIVAAIEKERLTRHKHDRGNDREAMQYVLDVAGIGLEDVELVVQNENFGMFRAGNAEYGGEARLLNDAIRVVTISHHLAHAYSAFGPCPFDDAAVLVIDGCGNAYEDCVDLDGAAILTNVSPDLEHLYFEKDSTYAATGGRVRSVAKDFSPWAPMGQTTPGLPTTLHSIGGVYHAFSSYVFGGLDDVGKLMGLAPYGRVDAAMPPIFELEGGRVRVDRAVLTSHDSPASSRHELKANFQYYADLAAWVQHEVERAVLYVARDRLERAGSSTLVYSGGVALNAVANHRLLREAGVDRLWIQPAAGDNGLAIGCAYYGWLAVLGEDRVAHDGTTCFGRAYGRTDVRSRLEGAPARVVEDVDPVEATADLIADGKVVGWFQGGSEFGPRALGHRSILAHPGRSGLRDYINMHVKFREDFRPFAPSVAVEDAATYFECDGHESPYMILVFPTRPEWRDQLCNVVHVDGSARLHTVGRSSDERYYQLLRSVEERTGLPILLNTSFNKRGMPIVETPDEAIDLFLESGLDALVLGDDVIVKSERARTDRVRGTIEQPKAGDIPMVGVRVSALSITYGAGPSADSGLTGSPMVDVAVTDSPRRVQVDLAAAALLRLCDGARTYGSIADTMGADLEDVLAYATALTRIGLLDHLRREPPAASPERDSSAATHHAL